LVRGYGDARPRIDPSVWLAPGSIVVGDVEIGADSSVWYGAVIRGDVDWIRIGQRTNVQDHCVLHVESGRYPCVLGGEVTVGHRAVVHACTVRDGALIGIGAIVLDGAEIGEEALLGAGAVATPGTVIPNGMLAVGVPARVVRALSVEERASQRAHARSYVEMARAHAAGDRS
jgi:carbonic anhydrase/acetyltransferase-like protein (isoleucine patch superfamily)